MKKLIIGFVFLLLFSVSTVPAQANDAGYTGKKLLFSCESKDDFHTHGCISYINGVLDAYAVMKTLNPNLYIQICYPPRGSYGQYERVVKKHLKQNPTKLQENAAVLVLLAMKTEYPCLGK